MFRIKKVSYLALICWFFTACTWTEIVDTVTGGRLEGDQLKTLVIQPLGKFPESKSRWLADTLTKIYRGPVKLNEKIPLPKETYSTFRPRYRADLLLKYLGGRTSKGSVSIGITANEMSTTKDQHKDWRIFGLANSNVKACVVSTYKFYGPTSNYKLLKTTLHEMGHVYGLKHCPQQKCIMRDAKGKDILNQVNSFCDGCHQVMVNKGWELY